MRGQLQGCLSQEQTQGPSLALTKEQGRSCQKDCETRQADSQLTGSAGTHHQKSPARQPENRRQETQLPPGEWRTPQSSSATGLGRGNQLQSPDYRAIAWRESLGLVPCRRRPAVETEAVVGCADVVPIGRVRRCSRDAAGERLNGTVQGSMFILPLWRERLRVCLPPGDDQESRKAACSVSTASLSVGQRGRRGARVRRESSRYTAAVRSEA